MSLLGLTELLRQVDKYQALCSDLARGVSRQVQALEAAHPFIIAALWHHLQAPLLVVCPRPDDARRLYEQLLTWCGEDAPLYRFGETETLPFERLVADAATAHARLRTLAILRQWRADEPPPLIVASGHAVGQKTLARSTFEETSHTLQPGQRVRLGELLSRWQALGYQAQRTVEVPGSMSHRGGNLDIYPPQAPLPLRIELWGEEIDSIRQFDPASQRSVAPVETVEVTPAQETLPPLADPLVVEAAIRQMDLSSCAPATQERIKEELALLAGGQTVEELPFYAGFFNQGCLLDYFPPEGVLLVGRPSEVEEAARETDRRALALREAKQGRGELPLGFPSSHLTWDQLRDTLHRERRLDLERWGAESVEDLGFSVAPSYWGRMEPLAQEVAQALREGGRVVAVSHHAARLNTILKDYDIAALQTQSIEEVPSKGMKVVYGGLDQGFRLPLSDGPLLVLSDAEVFGSAKRRRPAATGRRQPLRYEALLTELEPGSYLVHTDHGIGRFAGTVKLAAEEGEKEYLVLEYAEGDKLYVPTDQLDRVAPYAAPGETPPTVTRLGTQEWVRAKERVKASTRQMAQELLELYATRQVLLGIAISPDSPWQQELEDSFPYVETPDQMTTIQDVKTDMEQARPMDRLVCGDVGYGKTEVALRAAFKAVMDGMQVAVLVPTTVLAQQHYATFAERLSPFPVTVDVLSRFRTEGEQQQVLQDLVRGKIDIIIGTHRLLQKDVAFKNLGLVVIDEEQRFGVAHKERLKRMRREVDVLALSATPIPRTFHMSLIGVRDMSTMETPPEERLPIKTYVSEYSEDLIRDAILRELNRGGQVFFLHNRVRNIHAVAEQVRRLVPEATLGIGHGQMPEEQLAQVMEDFSQGKVDVLVCTTIIESGLDMPNVNTLIIDRADALGLAQLYQLRGRIGRGAHRAYAYLLVPRGRRITEAAEKRLKTILAATELGAGFRIAMRDLEIRGAGNLLGPQQSGYIHAVGFDLYTRLLSEAVEEAKAQQAGADGGGAGEGLAVSGIRVDLRLPTHLPEGYVSDLPTRLSLYQRFTAVKLPEDADTLSEELRDRFGSLPEAVQNLVYIVRLKAVAAQAEVEGVEQHGDTVVLKLGNWEGVDRAAIQRVVGGMGQVGHLQVRLDTRLMGQDWRQSLLMAVQRLASLRRELLERVAAATG